jgi:ABC-type lipoprotein release transport system permease subunit
MMDVVRLLVRLGIQSVKAHKRKSFIVGGLMGFGAFIVVLGTSLLDSVERSMRTSLVDSVTGDIQVYDKKAKDELQIFGGFGFGASDIGEIPKFAPVRDALMKIDNVKAVVPMGIANATVSSPGDLDRALGLLRDAVRNNDAAGKASAIQSVKRLVIVLADQRKKRAAISANGAEDAEVDSIIARAGSDEMWQEFDKDPLPILDELDGKLAPLGEEGQQIYLRMAGTDLDSFRQHFGKMKIIEGQMVPPGQRGLVVGQKFLDRRMKFAIAMNLDSIRDDLAKGKSIGTDQVLQETVAKNARLSPRILYMLSAADAPVVEKQLRDALGGSASGAKDLGEVLTMFLKMDDADFAARYKQFYDIVAPKIQLYPFKVGDTITLTSFTNSGYLKSVNVKIYGTYAFEGLESSDLAGALSLVDIMTFRDLYGARTADLDKELAQMKKTVGATEVKREDAEAALFGGDSASNTAAEVKESDIKGVDEGTVSSKSDRVELVQSSKFTQADVDNGLALSAAVLLKDPAKLWQTMRDINDNLGPQMSIQAVDWQRAAGIIGQFIWVIRGVLTLAILIIFAVAIVIINNSMVMATLERVAEIGTMRAIGAGKGFVTAMIIFETGVLGVLAGGAGALLGALVVTAMHAKGIPAGNDVLMFLFGGPRLYPFVEATNMVLALVATVVVSVAATLYPARLATRVSPVVAMQGKE